MPTSVRLDRATERKLTLLAARTGKSKSSLMREAIAALHERLEMPTAIAEQLGDYVAGGRLGPGITGRRAKEILAEGFGRRKRP
jgi:predicted transcriptional regulator